MISARKALEELQAGNRRFVNGTPSRDLAMAHERRAELVDGQQPLAVIVGCSDSRVPVEMVFDQGIGDLFVIRVAGNIVARSQIGSVEFAAEAFGTRLVVVMGHTGCGAVAATINELRQPSERQSPNLRSIVTRIRPAVEPFLEQHDGADLSRRAVQANVQMACEGLRNGSVIIEQLIASQGLVVVGAEYELETGKVEFFEGT